MKRIVSHIIVFFLLISPISLARAENTINRDNELYEINMKRDLLCLMMAYPEHITNIQYKDGSVYLVMKSGTKILYDDKRQKNFHEKLANPDLQDMMEEIYPLSPVTGLMDENFDPGRYRVYSLLKDVYGSSKGEIEKNLTGVNCGYKNYLFNSNNKAAESLKNVMEELIPLAGKNIHVQRCLYPTNGTYNYRVISGTNRLSPHAFGIAIDLARDKRDYWKWASREDGEKRLLDYSKKMVEIFEENNFVWGGKWGHFDILHFEYRPEIIIKAKYFTNKDNNDLWYEGAPLNDVSVKNYIEKINEVLK
ncbi:hypothetical protein BD780_001334 [Clostridium tetanomorphum]|uniref:M15 family metallopeptidase n=1 Tax=Clostridium tetanomorphum TaxID=1553 RepID=A0A923E7Q1_CLOTT|nr:M15 family metallopeptidase [Clostridium tetanomorphum]KAJ53554.1 hypothetical protein CTM_01684 [Clostridium tetanomorphum DSM 665]MBC2398072.1 M15 family metallopeptidase [Clostridium tetanomorphum]MBP1864639.1 hypothetical protein [Clostridium tetanomorphum]NRS84109.1 hypothetical protein [Clostridium tetanomorphum]NRZ97322.1 hypothetical protein [Clostridium tetanomorphum]